MSIELMSLVFKADIPDLQYVKHGKQRKAKASTVTLLMLAYADYANKDGLGAYPGYDNLERKTKLSRQGIADTLEAIKQNDLMKFTGVSSVGTNSYSINVSYLETLVKPLDSAPSTRVKPLDSAESSHLTQPSQATRLNPSVKPSVNRERESRARDFESMPISDARKVPTLKLYTEATKYFPGELLWGFVDQFITEHQLTKAKIKQAAVAWKLSGFKAENVKGILDWAAFGIPEKYQPNNHEQGEVKKTWTPIPGVEETRRMLEEKANRTGSQSIQDVMGQMQKG